MEPITPREAEIINYLYESIGPKDAESIIQDSGIPEQTVYRILNELRRKGSVYGEKVKIGGKRGGPRSSLYQLTENWRKIVELSDASYTMLKKED